MLRHQNWLSLSAGRFAQGSWDLTANCDPISLFIDSGVARLLTIVGTSNQVLETFERSALEHSLLPSRPGAGVDVARCSRVPVFRG
jgi:hypothetical protein